MFYVMGPGIYIAGPHFPMLPYSAPIPWFWGLNQIAPLVWGGLVQGHLHSGMLAP
jgi:hypothetical protein